MHIFYVNMPSNVREKIKYFEEINVELTILVI